ncbi:hypothetical protein PO909_006401 [Leuciscus waleckii]
MAALESDSRIFVILGRGSDGGPAPGPIHDASLKFQTHQPCEGLIDTTAIGTDPQQTRLHPGMMTPTSTQFTEVSRIPAVSRSDGGPVPAPIHDASLKFQPHQPCEGLIDTTAIGTDPQQTRLHPGMMTPTSTHMELDKYSECSDPI